MNFIGQDLPALGTNWTVETQFTVKYTGGWQNAGLIVWNGDNNFFRSSITHDLNGGNIYVEQSKDNPSHDRGRARRRPAATSRSRRPTPAGHDPDALHARQRRPTPSRAQYRVMAPASLAIGRLGQLPAARRTSCDLNPTSGARRDAAGSRIGIIAAVNFPGTAGTLRLRRARRARSTSTTSGSPRTRSTCETVAPTTTATLDPAAPATGDTYDRSVKVNLSATDAGTNAAGVEKTEYRDHHQRRRRQLDDAEQHAPATARS